jgi:4-hydroxyphenylacetate 3-monooxygenase
MSSIPSQSEQGRDSSPAGLRSGAQYLTQIRSDGRQVIYDGEVVNDVTSHPAFRGAARSIAGLWDIAADPANRELMTHESPRTGKPVLRCYHIRERRKTSLRLDA